VDTEQYGKLIYPRESYLIRGGCFNVYKELRNRHKEVVYKRALVLDLKDKGLEVSTEKQLPVTFDGKKVGVYIPDIIVNNIIFLELKCKSVLTRQDEQQFWHYLRATGYKLGFLINFGKADGVEIIRGVS